MDQRSYVTLDDHIPAALTREEPLLFLQRFRLPELIDEFSMRRCFFLTSKWWWIRKVGKYVMVDQTIAVSDDEGCYGIAGRMGGDCQPAGSFGQ